MLHRKSNSNNIVKIVNNVENNTSRTYCDFFCSTNLKENKGLMHLIFNGNAESLYLLKLRSCTLLKLANQTNCKYCSMFNTLYSFRSIITLTKYVMFMCEQTRGCYLCIQFHLPYNVL